MQKPAIPGVSRWWPFLFLGGILAIHLTLALQGWRNSVGGTHDFRQSQAAIASYYIASEGPMLDTKIPVLGPNWRIPFEFPAYQMVTAAVHRISGWPLDQCGRLVSLLCFYLSLIPLGLILRHLGFDLPWTLLTLALTASSPVYVFWSRSFMIESTALFLALAYAAAFLSYLQRPGIPLLVLTVLAGILAALTKFTTFSVVFGFLMLLFLSEPLRDGTCAPGSGAWRRPFRAIGLLAVPVLAGFLWSRHLNHEWLQSPLTRHMADSINTWNFGPFGLRFSDEFWGRFAKYGIGRSTVVFVPWLLAFAAFGFAPYRWRMVGLSAFAAWLAGPLVWTNLFFVHDYYYFATTVFGLVWITASAAGLGARRDWLRLPAQGAIILLCLSLIVTYGQSSYFESQQNDWGREKMEFARDVGSQVPEDSVLLILGEDWNPMIPYYAQRYALMLRWPGQAGSPEFQEAVELIGREGRSFAGAILRKDAVWEQEAAAVFPVFGVAAKPAIVSAYGNFAFHRLQ